MPGYDPVVIEKKWQKFWLERQVFAAQSDSSKPRYYALDMFPYPSGNGLHVGHPEGYTATDIVSRYKRAKGFAVLHPMGWDAFGLPAEQFAIKTNTHPRIKTHENINRFRSQLQSLGFSYDWAREVDTTDPKYFKWTQWIFLKLFDSWFDEAQQKGRPISELIAEFKSGKRALPEDFAGTHVTWDNLSATDQRKVLSQYRLAYMNEVPVNWCPGLGTVLANEEVVDGKSEVGGFPVERRPMRQWMLRITAYAERLIQGLGTLDWSDSLKEMQRNWIGRSQGAEVTFKIDGLSEDLVIFTTRPDTLFGVSYMVVAPEHPLVPALTSAGQKEKVEAYRAWAASRSDRERQEDTRKTGEFTGSYAINPVTGEKVPIYISDYVLMGYGTGAIMAVPAHDERDHEFATKFKLPIKQVVAAKGSGDRDQAAVDVQATAFCEDGVAVNSPWINGLGTDAALAKMIDLLEEKKLGKRKIQYKIRDWLFSRQRYWGEPFPLVHLEDGTVVRLADDALPIELPDMADFKPTGTIDPPLSKAPEWFSVHVVVDAENIARIVPAGTPGALKAKRELNTMPQWAGSCWYYIRYCDARNDGAFVSPEAEKFWLGPKNGAANSGGVDLYVGGVEHAVLHLLYSRFWHKVLFDRGLVTSDEPFRKLVNQGLILGEAEYTAFKTEAGELVSLENIDPEFETRTGKDGRPETISKRKSDGVLVVGEKRDISEVEKKGEGFVLKSQPEIRVDARSFKMSKSRGNVVNPDDVIRAYGADSLRMFEMFMGPLEQVKPWSTAGVEGVYRFLQRVWRNLFDDNDQLKVKAGAQDEALERALNKLIKKMSDDIDKLSLNTCIAAMMEFNNLLGKAKVIPQDVAERFVRVTEPFAPHFAEEVYHRMHPEAAELSISHLPWPEINAAMLIDPTIEIPVQVNGKLRGRVSVPNGAEQDEVLAAALALPEVQSFLAGKEPKKKIYVKGRMVNLVV